MFSHHTESVKKTFIFRIQGKCLMVFYCVVLAEPQSDRSIGEKKLRTSGDERPSMKELSGYNFKRQEFEIEYDNDAEHLLADMEFNKNDTDAERELKLRVLRIYGKRYLCTRMNLHVLGIRYCVQGLWTGLLLLS